MGNHEAGYRTLVQFFAISHGWSWLFWTGAVTLGRDVRTFPSILLVALGGLGPPIAGIVMTAVTGGRQGLGDLWRRVVEPGRIGGRWWAAIVFLPPLLMTGAVALAWSLGAEPDAADIGPALERVARPGRLLVFLGFVFLLGPLPEEIGWRGFALDALQERWSALTASIILALAWGLWHAPLFLMTSYFGESGRPDPLEFMFAIVMTTTLITWIYNNTRRSVLAAILFHFVNNFTGEVVETSAAVDWYRAGLAAAVVLVVIAVWGGRTMVRDSDAREQ